MRRERQAPAQQAGAFLWRKFEIHRQRTIEEGVTYV